MSTPPGYPRARHLLGWPFAAGLVLVVAAELTASARGNRAWNPVALPAWYLVWGGWVVWTCRRNGIGLRRLVGQWPRREAAWGYVGMALPLLVLSAGLFLLQAAAAAWAFPELIEEFIAEDPAGETGPTLASSVLQILVAVAIAPIVEELAFRGVLLRSWSRRRGRRAAVLGTAALFAVLHPTDLLGSFAFGVVLAAIRLRTRTLLVPIACHVLFNALVSLVSTGAPAVLEDPDSSALTPDELRSMAWVGVACLAVALPALAVFLRRQAALLAPQRHHRVQPGGPAGGSDPEDHPA